MAFTSGKLGGGGGKTSGGGIKVNGIKLSNKEVKKLDKMSSSQQQKYLLKKSGRAYVRSALGQAATSVLGGLGGVTAAGYLIGKSLFKSNDKRDYNKSKDEKTDSPKDTKTVFKLKK